MISRIYGTHEDRTIQQLERCLRVEGDDPIGVLCADGHVGYSMPIGGVAAYKHHISPSGVGYDIACGNMAVQTNVMAKDMPFSELERIADEIARHVSFGIGRKNNEPVDSPVFERIERSSIPWQRTMVQKAQQQLGTVGSGNHYVDILEDEAGVLWVAVHFGSRGFGWQTAKGFMNIAQGRAWDDGKGEGEMDAPPLLLQTSQPAAQDYIEAMTIAGEYAYEGRRAVVAKVLGILQAEAEFTVHNHHNFAWLEHHQGEPYWVVRKGATPAFPGQFGFVGGSMGDISVILEGVESEESRRSLFSTVHGAGRIMSRTQAAGKQKWTKASWSCGNYRTCDFSAPIRDYERKRGDAMPKCPKCGARLIRRGATMTRTATGLVDFAAEKEKLDIKGIILRGGGADEAPPVYRPLQSVLRAHAGTIDIAHVLEPRVVVMAGSDEFDPYKD